MPKNQFPEAPANKWPPQKEALLREHYATMPIPELAALLGKTESAIYGKAYHLGIVREAKVVRNGKDTYDGAELRPYSSRPGAMDAYKIPSRYLPNPPALKKGSSE